VLKIRLRREGSRNHPFFRVVVSDSRNTPTGPNVEILGFYDPSGRKKPSLSIDVEKYEAWIAKGAHASDTVRSLVRKVKASREEAAAAEATE